MAETNEFLVTCAGLCNGDWIKISEAMEKGWKFLLLPTGQVVPLCSSCKHFDFLKQPYCGKAVYILLKELRLADDIGDIEYMIMQDLRINGVRIEKFHQHVWVWDKITCDGVVIYEEEKTMQDGPVPREMYVYLRDPGSQGGCTVYTEKLPDSNELNLAFAFASPIEKHFNKKIGREIAKGRFEFGLTVQIVKGNDETRYQAVVRYLKQINKELAQGLTVAENVLGIKSYLLGKDVCLDSEFWVWFHDFVEDLKA